jgi:hypothetical protein
MLGRKMVLVGSFTGATAQFLASPTDLVKVIMQADGKLRMEGKISEYVEIHLIRRALGPVMRLRLCKG